MKKKDEQVELMIDTGEKYTSLEDLEVINPTQCARCNITLTAENNSRWEEFVIIDGETKTQPICIACHEKEHGSKWFHAAASAYDAWVANSGKNLPEFTELSIAEKTAWEAAVRQATDVLNDGSYGLGIEEKWAGWKSEDPFINQTPKEYALLHMKIDDSEMSN